MDLFGNKVTGNSPPSCCALLPQVDLLLGDPAKAQNVLGWNPQATSLEKLVQEMGEWGTGSMLMAIVFSSPVHVMVNPKGLQPCTTACFAYRLLPHQGHWVEQQVSSI
jgi:hypothetical protein